MIDLIKLVNDNKHKYPDWDKKAQNARNNFLNDYGRAQLDAYSSDADAVEKLIYCKTNTGNYILTKILQQKDLKACFGSVDVTTSVAIVLYYEHLTGKGFRYGKDNYISRVKANEISQKIFETMENICKIVDKTALTSVSDYERLEQAIISTLTDDIKNNFMTVVDKKNRLKTWFTKYLKLCFLDKFSSFYSENWTNFICQKLGINTSGLSPFARNGAISLRMNEAARKTGAEKSVVYKILLEEFCKEYEKTYGGAKPKGTEHGKTDEAEKYTDSQVENGAKDKEEIQELTEELKGYLAQNVIFYGVPGCGKSHTIKTLLGIKDDGSGMNEFYYKRILFHPEYSYSDFIGQLSPIVDKETGKPAYKFKAGPMTQILKAAYENKEKQFFLVIEEINRGNAPAIFGDFFQLLDRDKEGKSEYPIDNSEVAEILGLDNGKVSIPSNLTILATMNTCDQNVFTLDTAFKRRFRMCRIKNTFNNDTWVIKFDSGKTLNWKKFAEAVNEAILENCNDGASAEDKQLGAYFVKGTELSAQIFAEKVFMYLWDDVVKYDKEQLFKKNYKTLDNVIAAFVSGENVFSEGCTLMSELYEELNKGDAPAEAKEETSETEAEAAKTTESASEAVEE